MTDGDGGERDDRCRGLFERFHDTIVGRSGNGSADSTASDGPPSEGRTDADGTESTNADRGHAEDAGTSDGTATTPETDASEWHSLAPAARNEESTDVTDEYAGGVPADDTPRHQVSPDGTRTDGNGRPAAREDRRAIEDATVVGDGGRADQGPSSAMAAGDRRDRTSVADALAAELESGRVDDAVLATLADHLDATLDRAASVRLERLSTRVDELEAYTDALETFLDRIGTDEDLVHRFERVDERFEAIDSGLEDLDEKFAAIDDRFERIEEHLEALDDRAATVEDLDGLRDEIAALDDDLSEIRAWKRTLSGAFSDG